ncbi:hypothetical protein FISHEDRAFT_59109 [Fistulina hepatica ATCC 64428]|uniref:Single hybrid motif-containing protein n=1 Tax=Fistulina hepatica ATCC 64428 TaxID=1128425 RepID=A0A0D7ABF8_9AGAR|nr:hypothetical protein FISHEDRAFT_59109 [Fistulina hepatica ATCC 64428]
MSTSLRVSRSVVAKVTSSRTVSSMYMNSRRLLHATSSVQALSPMQFPAMSPTMTEGGISRWAKKEGESFTVGDVILEIETDKATIDVEAQDEGILAKIILPDGTKNIPVGKTIAVLAEEGDDISNVEIPAEAAAPVKPKSVEAAPPPPVQSTPAASTSRLIVSSSAPPSSDFHPTHSRTLFPSVQRLLAENHVENAETIKGTGVRGMLTKGDVLAYLGKASGPLGTYKPGPSPIEVGASAAHNKAAATPESKPAPPPLDGAAIRQIIVSSMDVFQLKASKPKAPVYSGLSFDDIMSDYLPKKPSPAPAVDAAEEKYAALIAEAQRALSVADRALHEAYAEHHRAAASTPPPSYSSSTSSYLDGLH